MDLINCYSSDTDSSDLNEHVLPRQTRTVYLVTYSQADLTKFPTRNDFANAVVESFTSESVSVLQWCCSTEMHKKSGEHYHMCLKLSRNQRWLSSKTFLNKKFGIQVHYSSVHYNYYSAWKYVTKSDEDFVQSPGHPDLTNATEPRTSQASRKRRQNVSVDNEEGSASEDSTPACTKKQKKKRLSALDVSAIIIEKKIHKITELHALAKRQKDDGKTDLTQFIVSRNPRVLDDLLKSSWEIEDSQEKLARENKTRLELMQEALEGDCVDGCDGQWLQCAQDILHKNGIQVQRFADAVMLLLEKGRGKYRNVMIVGPANCGKTFLLNPLATIFHTFCNPASGSFAWVGVQDEECIFLNDFRWSPSVIPWHDLLLMLEGHIVHLPAPKTHFAKDITFEKDTPIFATGKRPLLFLKNGVVDDVETEMMSVRWNIFHFSHQIPREQQLDILPCAKCFAKLVLEM